MQWVVNSLWGIALFLPLIALSFAVVLSGGFADLMGFILDWVISPNFIDLSYTRPTAPPGGNANPIIKAGLDVTQSFVNIILVLIMVYIALSIALRLEKEGDAKKLLPKLILVALLVNFAPVLVGLIVDASNIVMNYFLSVIQNGVGGLGRQATAGVNYIVEALTSGGGFKEKTGLMMQASVQIALNFMVGFAFLLFAALFIFRYIVIWILVILSPLAFVFWILPATKKYWDMWWHQLISWSIVGIPISFFLYLAINSFNVFQSAFQGNMAAPSFDPQSVGYFNRILPFAVTNIFLIIGFTTGLSTSAMGASAIISGGIKARQATLGWLKQKTKAKAKPWLEENLKVREAARRINKAWEGGLIGKVVRPPESLRQYAQSKPAVMAGKEAASPYSSRDIARRLALGADYGTRAVGGMLELNSRGDMQDFVTAYREKYKIADNQPDSALFGNADFKKEMARKLQIASDSGTSSTLLRGDPRLARAAAGTLEGYERLNEKDAVNKAVSEARRQHIGNWEREVLEDPDVINAGLGKGREFWEAIDAQVKRGRETSHQMIDSQFSDFVDRENLSHATPKDLSSAWKTFRSDYKNTHDGEEGYFLALDDPRFKARGWREGKYVPSDQRGVISNPPSVTPGTAIGLPTPTPSTPPPSQSKATSAWQWQQRKRQKRSY